MSLFSPHLIGTSGKLTQAALVPFCAYQTNMSLLGQTRHDLPFTTCNHFKPTILGGQLCHSLKLNFSTTHESNVGRKFGVLLMIDEGTMLRKRKEYKVNSINHKEGTSLNLDHLRPDKSSTRIYLNLLAPGQDRYTDYTAGSYALSSLKKMTGTESFLGLSEDRRGCSMNSYEDCKARRYIREVLKQCGCVPWALSSALDQEVNLTTLAKLLFDPPQPPTYCSPAEHGCYTAISRETFGCRISCTGLYADTEFTEDKTTSDLLNLVAGILVKESNK